MPKYTNFYSCANFMLFVMEVFVGSYGIHYNWTLKMLPEEKWLGALVLIMIWLRLIVWILVFIMLSVILFFLIFGYEEP